MLLVQGKTTVTVRDWVTLNFWAGAYGKFFGSAIYLFTRVMQTVLRVFIRIRLEDASKPAASHTLLS